MPLHYACFWGQDQVAEVSARALSSGMGREQSQSSRERFQTFSPACERGWGDTRGASAVSAFTIAWDCPHHSHL